MSHLRRVCSLVVALAALAGCDECVGEAQVSGMITDANDEPLAGVVVRQCWYDGSACRETTTDAAGRFALAVQVDSTKHEAICPLVPLTVSGAGCESRSVELFQSQVSADTNAGVIVMTCP